MTKTPVRRKTDLKRQSGVESHDDIHDIHPLDAPEEVHEPKSTELPPSEEWTKVGKRGEKDGAEQLRGKSMFEGKKATGSAPLAPMVTAQHALASDFSTPDFSAALKVFNKSTPKPHSPRVKQDPGVTQPAASTQGFAIFNPSDIVLPSPATEPPAPAATEAKPTSQAPSKSDMEFLMGMRPSSPSSRTSYPFSAPRTGTSRVHAPDERTVKLPDAAQGLKMGLPKRESSQSEPHRGPHRSDGSALAHLLKTSGKYSTPA